MGSSDIFNDQKISKILKGASTESDSIAKDTSKTDVVNQDVFAKPKRKNLFDEDDFDDFLETENNPKVISGEIKKRTVNLFDEVSEDEDIKPIKDNISDSKGENPPGVISNKNMDKKNSLFDDEEVISKPKKISLFDDDDELFNDDDFFSNVANTKLSSKLFDDIEEKSDNMFDIKYEQNKPKNAKKDLFSEDSDFDRGIDTKKMEDSCTVDNENSVKSTDAKSISKNSLKKSDVREMKNEEKQNVQNDNIIPKEANSESIDSFPKQDTSKPKTDFIKKPLSLFDEDDDSENDSIFGSKMKPDTIKSETKVGDITTRNEENVRFKINDDQQHNLQNQLEHKVKEDIPGEAITKLFCFSSHKIKNFLGKLF